MYKHEKILQQAEWEKIWKIIERARPNKRKEGEKKWENSLSKHVYILGRLE